ncbi:MAG TPA: hypothetical protein VM123_16080 [archaeon]|nr:hypothetical protein [archaeon]
MLLGRSKYYIFAAVLFLITGCSTRTTYYIQLQLFGIEVPCQGVEIDFSSYDYYAILDSLVLVNNPGPRPDSTEIMAILETYQSALQHRTIMADSVDTLREELEKLDNKSIEYRKKYPIFIKIEKDFKALSDELHDIHSQYLETKSVYDLKLKDWQALAYKGFTAFKEKIPPELQTKVETTDQDCMVKKLVLPYGKWWLHTEVRRPGTTNEKLLWSFELPSSDTDSTMIILDEGNAKIIRELL